MTKSQDQTEGGQHNEGERDASFVEKKQQNERSKGETGSAQRKTRGRERPRGYLPSAGSQVKEAKRRRGECDRTYIDHFKRKGQNLRESKIEIKDE